MFAKPHRSWHYVCLFGLSLAMFFANLGGASLWDVDEGRNATAALEMYESGNWLVPTFNGQLRAHKPALLYWLQLLAYSCLGIGEFAARLPSALAATAAVLAGYELARMQFTRSTALLAGVILATCPMLCGAARFANPDALLNLFTILTFWMLWRALCQPSKSAYAAVGVAIGLAILTKGPVGLILPAAVTCAFLAWERQWARLLDLRWAITVWVALLVSMPWYVWVAIETKADFIRGFLLTHNVDRFLSPMENHNGSPLYYLVILLVGTAPWSIFMALTLYVSGWSTVRVPLTRWRGAWEAAAEPRAAEAALEDRGSTSIYRFHACWTVCYLAFFTVAATKLPNYILPVLVPFAVLTARALDRWRLGQLALPAWLWHLSLACLLLIGAGAAAGLGLAGGTLNLPLGRTFEGLQTWAILGLVPICGAGAAWSFLRQQRRTALVVTLAATALLFLAPLAAYATSYFNRFKAPQPLVELADACQLDREVRIGGWYVEYLPSLNFYVRRDVTHMDDLDSLDDFLAQPLPVYLFVRESEWRKLPQSARYPIAARQPDLYRSGDVLVITNRQ